MTRVLVCGQTSKYRSFAFVRPGTVFDQKLIVFALSDDRSFAVLSSRVHEGWALFFGSTMKDDPVYTPSDCFETFPFPPTGDAEAPVPDAGRAYCEFRAALMTKHSEGLTKTYNRFHDPHERSPDIAKLRDLHSQMDRAVLDAYGWTDIQPVYDFREQLDESIRLTWAEDTRDEVLARLLELNRVMAAKEAEGAPAAKAGKKSGGKKGKKAKGDEGTLSLLPTGEDDK